MLVYLTCKSTDDAQLMSGVIDALFRGQKRGRVGGSHRRMISGLTCLPVYFCLGLRILLGFFVASGSTAAVILAAAERGVVSARLAVGAVVVPVGFRTLCPVFIG